MTIPPAFGSLLAAARVRAGYSQQAIAERAQLSVDAIRALERGRRTAPRLDTVALLSSLAAAAGETEQAARLLGAADALRVSAGELIDAETRSLLQTAEGPAREALGMERYEQEMRAQADAAQRSA